MGVVDTSKLPVGQRERAAFVAALEASDDRAERHYLELKTEFDLNRRADRRKVVKFILGAAHREPSKAARHFEGHAVLVLGLPLGGVRGLPKFEVKDLEREVNEFAGPDPPAWDIDRVAVDEHRDIVLIIVDPPTGRIWPVLKDGEPLWSGDIYMRADGETRKANGPEVVAMLARSAKPGRVLDLAVEPVGGVEAYVVDIDELRAFIEWHAERLEAQVDAESARPPFELGQPLIYEDTRSRDAFLNSVEEWAADAMEEPVMGLYNLAAQMSRAFRVKIVNNTTASLKDVRLDISFDAALTALDWEEQGNDVDLFANRPPDWGHETFLTAVNFDRGRLLPPSHSLNGSIRIDNQNPAELVVELRRLHAEQTVLTPDGDIVLVAFVGDQAESPQRVVANWRLVAGEINEVLKGTFEVSVSTRDWRGPVQSVISHRRGGGPVVDEG